jgi:hypothetical protein
LSCGCCCAIAIVAAIRTNETPTAKYFLCILSFLSFETKL